jgi:hypothetical protein
MQPDSSDIVITSEVACKLIDPTAVSLQLDNDGSWFIWAEPDQPLAMDSRNLYDREYLFDTEAEAWQEVERFLVSSNIPTNAA